MTPPIARPYALVAELTYRCPLKCPFCSNPLALGRYLPELDTATWLRLLNEAAELGVVQLHFSGGEPLLRRDLPELLCEARRLGLYTNLSTGATLADESRLRELREAGLDAIQISLVDIRPESNDWATGAPSFQKKCDAIVAAKKLGYPVTINVPLYRGNLDQIEPILRMACQWQIDTVELGHTQYIGWAFRNRDHLLPTREQVERATAMVDRARDGFARDLDILYVLPDYYQKYPKPCLQGWGNVFLTIAPDGAVLPCQAAREIPGLQFPSVHDETLEEIWFDAPVFQRFRGTDWMPDPCRSCDRREIDYGGCRCQAFLLTGNAAATDPVCHLSPHHDIVQRAIPEAAKKSVDLQFRLFTP